jgi:hypothetical protein
MPLSGEPVIAPADAFAALPDPAQAAPRPANA